MGGQYKDLSPISGMGAWTGLIWLRIGIQAAGCCANDYEP